MWGQVGGAVVGGLVGYRFGGRVGAAVGAVGGAVALPRLLESGGVISASTSSSTISSSGATADGIRIGRAVQRPSTADAISMLRPTLALYGSRELASAALANAYAESRFDPLAGGDVDSNGTPQAIGLFQLHSKGAGAGMTVADRADPVRATRRILEEAAQAGLPGAAPSSAGGAWWESLIDALDGDGAPTVEPVAGAVSLATLTSRFTVEVERPANAGLRAVERVTSLRTDTYLRNVLTGLGLPVL